MKTNYILYFLIRLVKKGKEWQNKDLNGNELGTFGISWLQIGALLLAGLYVFKCPLGLSGNDSIIDFILSSLSITTALLFSIIVVVLDRARQSKFEGKSEKEQLNDIHQWNHMYQFASLTGNAILWSLLVIVILISTMIYGHEVDLSQYNFCGKDHIFEKKSFFLFIQYVFVASIRFVLIYGLFNFFVLFLFALLSLFETICSELDIKKPRNSVNPVLSNSVDNEIKKLITPKELFLLKLFALIIFGISVAYVLL